MATNTPHWPQTDTGAKRTALFLAVLTVLLVCAVSMDAYAYDLRLIEVGTLANQKDRWSILDARTRKEYRKAHLPGARLFSWEEYTRVDAQKIPYRIWPPDELAAALGAMGINEKTKVVLYGDADTSWGGEGWGCWALIWLGHQGPLRLLHGGVQAWQQAGLPMVDTAEKPLPPREYHIHCRAEVTIATTAVAALAGNQVLIDTRSSLEWFRGHLPEAIHLPWTSLYQGQDRRPIAKGAYARLLSEHGVQASDELIFYCTGGIRSAYAWVIHQLHGSSPAKNYEGGTEAWNRRPAQ